MIKLSQGDLLKADAQALVNTVNCVGVMGRGIALQFKKAYPENFLFYKSACDKHELRTGTMLVYETNQYLNPKYIINFPTKRHWKANSQIADIDSGLEELITIVKKLKIESIAIPPLGCGLGGLDWKIVKPKIEKAFSNLSDVKVLLYEPKGSPAAELMAKSKSAPNMTVGRATLLCLMRHYLRAVMDPYVTLLEIHKLMYFMQEAGEGLKLQYKKARYGPYAKNLRHVLNHIEGHFISGFSDAEDDPRKKIELLGESSKRAKNFLESHPETTERYDRVADLIQGFESSYGMELLSTVHWVASRENAKSIEEVTSHVHSWNERKKYFEKKHILIAWKVLKEKKWII